MTEDEYLDTVERIQQAMCIEPFRPPVADVVALIGERQLLRRERDALREANASLLLSVDNLRSLLAGVDKECHDLRAEIERLNAERQGWADTFAQNMKVIGAENARLRAALTEITDLELEGDAALADAMTIADEAL